MTFNQSVHHPIYPMLVITPKPGSASSDMMMILYWNCLRFPLERARSEVEKRRLHQDHRPRYLEVQIFVIQMYYPGFLWAP